MSRPRKIVTILGAQGVGKTTLVMHLARQYLSTFGPGSIRALDPANQFEEFGGEWPGRGGVRDWINALTAHGDGPRAGGWGPGLLILDDADRYIQAHAYTDFQDVWIANRHLGLDVIVSAHRPQGVPKDLLGCTHELYLFQQEEPLALEYLMRIPSLKRMAAEAADEEMLPEVPFVALKLARGNPPELVAIPAA